MASCFTSLEFTNLLKDNDIQISMDGKGCWRENEQGEFQCRLTFRLCRNYNVFVERLWKSIKYDELYLHAYDSVSAAKQGLARYLAFYNQPRPYSSLDRKTPDEFYYDNLPRQQNAAWAITGKTSLMKQEILSKQTEPLQSASFHCRRKLLAQS